MDQLDTIIQKLKDKEMKANDIPPGKIFFFVMKRMWQEGNMAAVNMLRDIAIKRLERNGNQWCQGVGWCKTKDIPFMGISLKNGVWAISDKAKYNGFNSH